MLSSSNRFNPVNDMWSFTDSNNICNETKFGIIPDPKDCKYYYICSSELAFRRYCPLLTLYDYQRKQCVTYSNAECFNKEQFFCPRKYGLFRHRKCDRYWICANGKATLKYCPFGRKFDIRYKKCRVTLWANCIDQSYVEGYQPVSTPQSDISSKSSISTTTESPKFSEASIAEKSSSRPENQTMEPLPSSSFNLNEKINTPSTTMTTVSMIVTLPNNSTSYGTTDKPIANSIHNSSITSLITTTTVIITTTTANPLVNSIQNNTPALVDDSLKNMNATQSTGATTISSIAESSKNQSDDHNESTTTIPNDGNNNTFNISNVNSYVEHIQINSNTSVDTTKNMSENDNLNTVDDSKNVSMILDQIKQLLKVLNSTHILAPQEDLKLSTIDTKPISTTETIPVAGQQPSLTDNQQQNEDKISITNINDSPKTIQSVVIGTRKKPLKQKYVSKPSLSPIKQYEKKKLNAKIVRKNTKTKQMNKRKRPIKFRNQLNETTEIPFENVGTIDDEFTETTELIETDESTIETTESTPCDYEE